MSQDSSKKTVPSPREAGLEYNEAQPLGFQVVRPLNQQSNQASNQASNQQIGQGIVAPGPQSPVVRHEAQFVNDDISTFFRNRQAVAQGSFGLNPILKFFIAVSVVTAGFITSWNYAEPVRKHAQKFGVTVFDISFSDFVPVWTKKAKAFQNQSEKEIVIKAFHSAKAKVSASGTPIDPIYLSVVSGFWPQIESYIASRCPRWEPTSGCSVRAWYLAYRGMKPSLRPVQSMNPSALAKLSSREQAMFSFAKAASMDGLSSEQVFRQALVMTSNDPDFRKLLFDARFKAVLRDDRSKEIPSMINLSRELAATNADLSKWRSMEIAMRVTNLSSKADLKAYKVYAKQIAETLRNYGGSFKSDPLAFITIARAGLRLDLGKNVSAISDALTADSSSAALDPSIRREMYMISARALMLSGDLTQAAERIKVLQRKDGADAVSNHLLGSIYLEMRSPTKVSDAVTLFQQASKAKSTWQSQAGLLLALTRTGKISDGNRIASALLTQKTTANDLWIQIVMAEYKLAIAKAGGDLSFARYKEVASSLSGIYARYPNWQSLAGVYVDALSNSGQEAEAQKVRLKMDDVSAKKSYLSSAEYLESPTGPFVFMR